MRTLKAGIIGLGVGEQHIAGYQANSRSEAVVLCDFDKEKLNVVGQKYPGLRLTECAEDVLSDPEVNIVSICSYDNYHAEQIIAAVRSGKHVFVEKPMCLQPEEARAIRTEADRNPGLKISSNLILRRCPRFIEVRNKILAGEFGKLFHIEGDYNYGRLSKITDGWRGRLDFYSVICGGGVHMIDLLLWLTGDKVTEVAAFGNAIASSGSDFRYNDMVLGILKFENGLAGKISANFGCVMPHFHGLSIYGTEATFVNGRDAGWMYTSREPREQPAEIRSPYPGCNKSDMIGSFIDAILAERDPEVGLEDMLAAMSICFAIEQAANRSCTVAVEYI